jgi:diguanylate cyclase (GGDEF)-like protein
MISLTIEKSTRRQSEKQITHLAYYDQLTNLPNRVLLQEELTHALEKAERDGHIVAVLFIDLDQFKNINDSLGHKFGDLLLEAVANRIKSCVRQVDLIARMGGDEFILVLPKINKKADVTAVAKRIISSFEKPLNIQGQEFYITTSIGIGIYPDDGTDYDTLIKHADLAMYHAKEKGRNGFEFYQPWMSEKTSEKLLIENNLHKALENNEFEIYYQPIVDLKTGKIRAAEALLRWVHPQLGMISPGDFIPLAEITGLIVPIGEKVLRTAFLQLKQWQESGFTDLEMSINLSARQLQNGNFIDTIKNIRQETGVEFGNICLEITETISVESENSMIGLIRDLRNMGMKIAIDDFGKGYSLLSYLNSLPITTLKIDQSFIRDMTQDERNALLVKLIIDLAHNFGLEVIAEGVELVAEKELLKEWNCHMVQGYLFSRPVSAQDFYELLKQTMYVFKERVESE